MEQYELTLLFSVKDERYQTGSEAVRATLQKMGGELGKEEDLGERPLAYPVDKEEHGHYLCWDVKLAVDAVATLKDELQAQVAVLKFLLLKKRRTPCPKT